MRLPIILALGLLLLCPACAHYEPSATESASAQRLEVREEGTKGGKPYVKLVFRPLLRDAARERLTPQEARVFVEALEEAFERTEGRAMLWISHPQRPFDEMTQVVPNAGEQWRNKLLKRQP